ncbi:Arsenate reductase, glutaredoxin family [Pseudomonas aeruginosa PA38182]|nr:Arsenate reductase, glutaredoxin family [Pseudomonas aeruginosa PA38182]
MQRQVLRAPRGAVAAQVVRRGADHRAAFAEAAGDQVGVELVGDAQGQVDALLHQVDHLAVDLQVDGGARVALDEGGGGTGQPGLGEGQAAGDAQSAARAVAAGLAGGLHGVGHGEHLAALWQQLRAGVGQAQAAGAAVQQACADPLLQLGEVARDHRPGHVQTLGGGGLAAAVDDFDEDAGGGQAVHDSLDPCNKAVIIAGLFARFQATNMASL